MIVYTATNRVNGKVYVGQSILDLQTRRRNHLYSARTGSPFRFHAAIRKYGEESFDWAIVFETDDRMLLLAEEERVISELGSMTYGYNARPGGTGGWIVPPEKFESWRTKVALKSQGSSNGRHNGFSDEELIALSVPHCVAHGRVLSSLMLRKLGVPLPRSFSKNRFSGKPGEFSRLLVEATGLPYDPYFRSEEMRKRLSLANTGKVWITNGTECVLHDRSEPIPNGFRRGRTCSRSKK